MQDQWEQLKYEYFRVCEMGGWRGSPVVERVRIWEIAAKAQRERQIEPWNRFLMSREDPKLRARSREFFIKRSIGKILASWCRYSAAIEKTKMRLERQRRNALWRESISPNFKHMTMDDILKRQRQK